MTRFCKQRDGYSCGPVAILNAIKWTGSDWFTYRMLPAITQVCNTTREGTYDKDMDAGLRYMQSIEYFSIVKPKKISKKRVRDHILLGGGMIAAYKEKNPPNEWHYAFFICQHMNDIDIINHSTGKELITCHRTDLDSIYPKLDKSAIWLITK